MPGAAGLPQRVTLEAAARTPGQMRRGRRPETGQHPPARLLPASPRAGRPPPGPAPTPTPGPPSAASRPLLRGRHRLKDPRGRGRDGVLFRGRRAAVTSRPGCPRGACRELPGDGRRRRERGLRSRPLAAWGRPPLRRRPARALQGPAARRGPGAATEALETLCGGSEVVRGAEPRPPLSGQLLRPGRPPPSHIPRAGKCRPESHPDLSRWPEARPSPEGSSGLGGAGPGGSRGGGHGLSAPGRWAGVPVLVLPAGDEGPQAW